MNLFRQVVLGGIYPVVGNSMAAKNKADWAEKEKALCKLVGARLTSVQFVMDYLIVGFDEKGALTTLIWPEVFNKIRKSISVWRDIGMNYALL